MMDALHEIQAADLLGYIQIKHFRRDLRAGRIPAPDRELNGGPVWSRRRLEAWLHGDLAAFSSTNHEEQEEAVRRVSNG